MIEKANVAKNKKAPGQVRAMSQGKAKSTANLNSTTLAGDKARFLKGVQLYQSGAVEIGPDGFFYVNGYRVNPDGHFSCECPDFRYRQRPCKHLFATWQFQKHGPIRDSLIWFC